MINSFIAIEMCCVDALIWSCAFTCAPLPLSACTCAFKQATQQTPRGSLTVVGSPKLKGDRHVIDRTCEQPMHVSNALSFPHIACCCMRSCGWLCCARRSVRDSARARGARQWARDELKIEETRSLKHATSHRALRAATARVAPSPKRQKKAKVKVN